MAIIKNDWADAWTTNLTTDPAYGAIPPLTVSSGGTGNTISNVTISDGTGFGGYTIGGLNGATGSNAVWTTNTTATGSFTIGPNYSAVGSQLDQNGRMSLRGENADIDINGKSGERYRKLEKKCKEKAEVWKKLKAMPKPEVKW